MQQNIAFHLVRLALFAITPLNDDAGHDDESMQLSATHQPQQFRRVGSNIGDFEIKHGLQKIPCAALIIGNLMIPYSPDQLLVFYDSERSVLSICFKTPEPDLTHKPLSKSCMSAFQSSPRSWSEFEFILEYHSSQVSHINLEADSDNLILTLDTVPKFYIRDLTNQMDEM